MDARQRWQALQAQLTLARAALDKGDRAAALTAVDAALSIDPQFLAAHSLRERALQLGDTPRPLVSAEGYAQFEQRARRRRVDRRVDAARAALSSGRLKDAAAALEEVTELDPNLPDLAELTAEFDALRRSVAAPRSGRWVAAAAAFAVVILGASWLQEGGGLVSRPLVAIAPLVTAPESTDAPIVPAGADASLALDPNAATTEPIATSGAGDDVEVDRAVADRTAVDRTADPVAAVAAAAATPPTIVPGYVQMPAPTAAAAVTPPPAPPLPTPLISPIAAASNPAPAAPPPVVAAVVTPPAAAPPTSPAPVPTAIKPDDEALVQQTLQRYRSAYEGLDAHSARAVWPAVNESALARAFDGLQSQTLTFDACDVRLNGDAAAAVCHGSARYVPKIGSREPRIESRTWNFTLRKSGAAWEIESARAQR